MPASECCGFILGADEAFRARIKCMYLEELFFLTAGTGCHGSEKLCFSPWTWCEQRWGSSPAAALSCCHSLAWLSVAQCPQYSADRDPQLSAPSVTLQGRTGPPSWHGCHLDGGGFDFLGWCQSWSECELGLSSRSVILASVMDLGS